MEESNRRKAESIERCGVKIPKLDLNEIAVQKEIGSQPNSDEEEEEESDLDESLFEEGSSVDSKYQKIDTKRRNEIFEQQKKSFKARMMGAQKEDLNKVQNLNLKGLDKQPDFTHEFMAKADEFSESWRQAVKKQPIH